MTPYAVTTSYELKYMPITMRESLFDSWIKWFTKMFRSFPNRKFISYWSIHALRYIFLWNLIQNSKYSFTQMNMKMYLASWQQLWSGGWFNIKMPSYQYRKFHCGDKTILRPPYLHNGISYTGKMTSLYWIRALILNHYLGSLPFPLELFVTIA